MSSILYEIMTNTYSEAIKKGFPPFLHPEWQSTPVNASPYWVSVSRLVVDVDESQVRSRLVAALIRARENVLRLGLCVDIAMVGGSFVEWGNPEPRDIDCVMFYSLSGNTSPDTATMRLIEQAANAAGVDMRLTPMDGDPMVLIRTVSFFTMLYMRRRRESDMPRAILLVDFRTEFQ